MIATRQIEIPDWVIPELEANKHLLQPDQSNYAKGRMRGWLFYEWHLQRKEFLAPQIKSSKLEGWCKEVWPQTEIGLITYSGESGTGIALHRDDSYSDFKAVGINITGECKFTYMLSYLGFEWSKERAPEKEEVHILTPGTVVEFNCKNRHSAEPGPNRWNINLWHISRKLREQFEQQTKK
jgi:hypothetical protein